MQPKGVRIMALLNLWFGQNPHQAAAISSAHAQVQHLSQELDTVKRSSRYFAQVAEHSQSALMLLDHLGKIQYCNPALHRLLAEFAAQWNQHLPHVNLHHLAQQDAAALFAWPAAVLQPSHPSGVQVTAPSTISGTISGAISAAMPGATSGALSGTTSASTAFSFPVGTALFNISVSQLYCEQQTHLGTMLQWQEQSQQRVDKALLQQLAQQHAIIEIDNQGMIRHTNARWQQCSGANHELATGRHIASAFADDDHHAEHIKTLLEQAHQGLPYQGEFKLNHGKQKEVWLDIQFTPVLDPQGQLHVLLGYGRDITSEKLNRIDHQGQMTAIHRSQAVIEFTLDGIILQANKNFLATLGYNLDEIQGKHHSMFVDEEYKRSLEYKAFWDRLKAGEFFADEYKRIGKGGKEIWIQASYNPIFGSDGKPFKVVKYATDITNRKVVVNEIKRVMLDLSAGDLTTRIQQPFAGEFAELGQAIGKFIETLQQTIQDISIAADTINNAAAEISTGNTDLSSRTEQQASNLEETASSMEELNGTVQQNSDNAKQANVLAAKAADVAVSGGQLIDQVVTTMASINDSAQQISDIIGVIDGIAFQTNILALNAAVEAARAGEQGRGFAVVAAEVRTLAQRSANAAKDIKALISDSVNKIRSGNELVDRSGSTMKDVVTSIKRVNDIMAEIAAASVQQASGIDEISRAVNQMDEMTQQNASLVEEAAAAAESLLNQAEQLNAHVALFKLDENSEPHGTSHAQRSRGAIHNNTHNNTHHNTHQNPGRAPNKNASHGLTRAHANVRHGQAPAKINGVAQGRSSPAKLTSRQQNAEEEWENF
jgi:methyl-accepting chemotaxis protein